mmetsp:Transcript_40445/g.102809  ORF Transcript_40445/g.102809 Transcript_40445/m.102809 type:complete len:439 (+) Transcript_40445:46-1362(+)
MASPTRSLEPFDPVLSAAAEPVVLPVPAGAVKVLPRWAEEDQVRRWRLKYRQQEQGETDRSGEEGSLDDGLAWVEVELRSFTRELPLVGLQHGEPHIFKVAVETPHGWSDWSTVVSCIPPSPLPPGKCAAVLASVHDDTTALVAWTRPIDCAAAVNIGEVGCYRVLTSWPNGQREEMVEGDIDHHFVTGLECLTDYRFQVSGENCSGWGEYSDLSPVLQVPPPVPHRLQQPTLRRATHHTAVIQWQHPQSSGVPVDSFGFRYTTAEAFPEGKVANPAAHYVEVTDVPSNASQFVIQNLRPGQQYIFQVRALNKFGKGVWSDTSIPTRTLEGKAPSKISSLAAPNIYRSFITLQWTPAEENGYEVTSHLMRYANKEDMSDAQEMVPIVVNKGGLDQCELRHLKKSAYWFQIAAFNEVGRSGWSDPCHVNLSVEHRLEDA